MRTQRAKNYIGVLAAGLALIYWVWRAEWPAVTYRGAEYYFSAVIHMGQWWWSIVTPLVAGVVLLAVYLWHVFAPPSRNTSLLVSALGVAVSVGSLLFHLPLSTFLGLGSVAVIWAVLNEPGKPNNSLQARRP